MVRQTVQQSGRHPFALGAVLFAAGEYFFGAGLSFLLWGLCARMVACYHSTWFVNSATHIWGYRNYETTDRSRNLWWVALLSYGERSRNWALPRRFKTKSRPDSVMDFDNGTAKVGDGKIMNFAVAGANRDAAARR